MGCSWGGPYLATRRGLEVRRVVALKAANKVDAILTGKVRVLSWSLLASAPV